MYTRKIARDEKLICQYRHGNLEALSISLERLASRLHGLVSLFYGNGNRDTFAVPHPG